MQRELDRNANASHMESGELRKRLRQTVANERRRGRRFPLLRTATATWDGGSAEVVDASVRGARLVGDLPSATDVASMTLTLPYLRPFVVPFRIAREAMISRNQFSWSAEFEKSELLHGPLAIASILARIVEGSVRGIVMTPPNTPLATLMGDIRRRGHQVHVVHRPIEALWLLNSPSDLLILHEEMQIGSDALDRALIDSFPEVEVAYWHHTSDHVLSNFRSRNLAEAAPEAPLTLSKRIFADLMRRAEQGQQLVPLPVASDRVANDVGGPFTTPEGPDAPQAPGDASDSVVSEHNEDTLPKIHMQFHYSSGGRAGLLDMDGVRMQLTVAQLELMELLVSQMQNDASLPLELRGFVPSSELVAKISWESPYPSDNHLKQLIRRVRRMLANAELGNLIESRRGFGYRLRCNPTDAPAP